MHLPRGIVCVFVMPYDRDDGDDGVAEHDDGVDELLAELES
jgi:hypothetical protein